MPYKDPAQQSRYQQEWRSRRRKAWLAENGPCARCGSWEDLEIDHVDPSKKVSHRIWSWTKERRDAELAKCQVLCRPHHVEKTALQEGYGIIEHGTHVGYSHYGCRCSECSEAQAVYQRAWRRSTIATPV